MYRNAPFRDHSRGATLQTVTNPQYWRGREAGSACGTCEKTRECATEMHQLQGLESVVASNAASGLPWYATRGRKARKLLMSQSVDAAGQPDRRILANAIRALSMDAVQAANSGHPGAPMGMADIAEVLWRDYLRHNPSNPRWANRDRFVLSNGHGSMLLYSLLHLSGYDLAIDEIRNFRQLGQRTAGHPEYEPEYGRRDDDGAAGAGHQQRCRHGTRGEDPVRGSSIATLMQLSTIGPGCSWATAA